MSDGPRRSSDEAIARLEQKLDDHIALFDRHFLETKDWRDSVDKRLNPLEGFLKRVETPVNIAGWVLLTITGAIILKIVDWVYAHWKK